MKRFGIFFFSISFFILGCSTQNDSNSSPQPACGFQTNVYGRRVTWHKLPVVLTAHSSIPNEWIPTIKAAFEMWNDKAGKKMLALADEVDNSANPKDHPEKNLIFIDRNWDPQKINEQATTAITWIGDQLKTANIRFNGSEVNGTPRFSYYTDYEEPGELSLKSIMEHEGGHALGYVHHSTMGNIMYPVLKNNENRTEISQDLVNELQCAYGS